MVAEVNGKVIANSEIGRGREGYERHVGGIGVAIKKGFRDLGIGTEMMKALMKQARGIGLKVLKLSAFETNKRAIHVYEKFGFVQTGRVPRKFFRDGRNLD
jgi:hypothetical protein